MAPLATGEDLLGDFSDCEIGITVRGSPEGEAKNKQGAILADLVAELLELIRAEILRGDEDEVPLGGFTMLPVDRITGSIGEAFQFANGFGEHDGIEFFADDPVAPLVFF